MEARTGARLLLATGRGWPIPGTGVASTMGALVAAGDDAGLLPVDGAGNGDGAGRAVGAGKGDGLGTVEVLTPG